MCFCPLFGKVPFGHTQKWVWESSVTQILGTQCVFALFLGGLSRNHDISPNPATQRFGRGCPKPQVNNGSVEGWCHSLTMMDDRNSLAAEGSNKKSRKENFSWTYECNLELVKLCQQKRVHLKTTDASQTEKWITILAELKKMEIFSGLSVKYKTLMTTYANLRSSALKDCGYAKCRLTWTHGYLFP